MRASLTLFFSLLTAAGFCVGVEDANQITAEVRQAVVAQKKAAARGMREEIVEALARVSQIKRMGNGLMENGLPYRLLARGEFVSACDSILRRREPAEILASNLSSGCGDYAAAFYGLMRRHGRHLRFIDSVDITMTSLENRFTDIRISNRTI